MLTDAERLLIAEAVDGPLTSRRVAELGRLVAGNPAARELLDGLHADRHALHALPRLTAPDGFADEVIVRVQPASPAVRRSAGRRPAWLPYATAAGVFLAVAVASYWLTPGRGGRSEQVAKSESSPPNPAPSPTPPERVPVPRLADPPLPDVVRVAPAPAAELAPSPRPVTPPVLSAAGLFAEIAPPAEVSTRLPVLGPVADLDSAPVQAQIVAELATLGTARIDLFSTDTATATTHVQSVAAACGLSVGVEATTRTQLKAKQPGVFALYTEATTATDVAKLLAKLAARQREGASFAAAHLTAAGTTDLRELKELFGDAKRTSPAREAKDDSTVGQVVKQLGTPAAKRPAFLFMPARPATGTKELRTYLDARGERKPGTVALLIVVRPVEPN